MYTPTITLEIIGRKRVQEGKGETRASGMDCSRKSSSVRKRSGDKIQRVWWLMNGKNDGCRYQGLEIVESRNIKISTNVERH